MLILKGFQLYSSQYYPLDYRLSIGERGTDAIEIRIICMYTCVCVCVHVCMYDTFWRESKDCDRAFGRTALVLGSFERAIPVLWACGDMKCVGCNLILTHLFSAEVTIHLFLRYALSICYKTDWNIETSLRWTAIGKVGMMGFSAIPKTAPTSPFPIWGNKHEKLAKSLISHFHIIQLCWEVFAVNKI